MSRFKRYQSKVFWNEMESLDLRTAGCMPDQSTDHEDEEIIESDCTTDAENTTVIHVPSSPCREEKSIGPASPEDLLAERSFSPASRGQRSQDSGFSDSGRSDSSGTSGIQSPERRRRRQRSSRRKRSSLPRLPSLRAAADADSAATSAGPAHTSTPKTGLKKLHCDDATATSRQLQFSFTNIRKHEEGQQLSSLNSSSGETLNDFLYATEPALEGNDELSVKSSHSVNQSYPRIVISCTIDRTRAPVRAWLEELCLDVEDEVMATLQSKSLPKRKCNDGEVESRDLRLLTASATTAAKKIVDVAENFDKIYQQLIDSLSSSKISRRDRELLESFETEATEILVKFRMSLPRRINLQENNARNLAVQLGRLKNNVDRALDNRLDFYIKKVVRGLEDSSRTDGSGNRGALAALTALGLAGPRAGSSVSRCSGIRALLTTFISASRHSTELRSSILRALASVCCCLEPVDQFVQESGPELLAEILVDDSTPESEKSEGAALLVQITAPWMDYVGLPYVEPFGKELVKALTSLAENTACKQTLLLAAAAINHLAHSRRCIAAIIESDSIKKLLRCVKKSNGGNVWLMEQVASLVGLVARVPQARSHLAETRASVALVCFLRMQPPGLEDEYRRLALTASEALTRLCVDPEIAKQVVAVGGSDCLPGSQFTYDTDHLKRQINFNSTKSLRVARKIAAEQIDNAKIWDHSPR